MMQSLPKRFSPHLRWIVPVVAVACLLAWCYVAVRPTHAWDDAEPEILNQAWRLSRGLSIYRSIEAPPYLHTAYPPLYFALVAGALKMTGLSYIPAKLVSLISVLAIGCAMTRLGRLWRRDGKFAWWLVSLLVLVPAFLYNSTRAHVQMLAVALSLISFVLFLRKGRIALIASAVAAVLAVYTKQTQIALPVAMLFCLALSDLRRLVVYLGALLLSGVPPLLWLQWQTSGQFLENTIFLNRLSHSVADVPLVLLHWAGPLVLIICIASHEVWSRARKHHLEELDFYFIVVAIATLVTSGRLGAHSQYVVELCVVAVLFVLRNDELRVGSSGMLAAQALLLVVYAPIFALVEEGRFGMASNRAAPEVERLLSSVPGPVLSQQSSFSLFSRGEIPIQLFHFTALAREGLWDMGRLEDEVERRSFAWVVTEFPIESATMTSDDLERFTTEVVDALRANYVRAEVIAPYFVYRRRGQ